MSAARPSEIERDNRDLRALSLVDQGMPWREVSKITGISPSTLNRLWGEIRELDRSNGQVFE